jgi:hypothetical protein
LVKTTVVTGNLRVAHQELWFYPLECQWIRAYGGALPCRNKSEKGSFKILKNKSEIGKLYEIGKNVCKKITIPILI